MSFPSALQRLESGDTPEASLLHAFRTDTPLGFKAIRAVVEAVRVKGECCTLCTVKSSFDEEHRGSVLRCEEIGEGIAVDFDPLSEMGQQIGRLLGTDIARPLIEKELGMELGYANCCKIIASHNPSDVIITPLQQIQWQRSIDC